MTACTVVLGVGEVIKVGETEVELVGVTVTVGETLGDGVTLGDGLTLGDGETDGDGLAVTVGETLGDGDATGQFTQKTLCFTSAPCAPGAWIVSLRCQPCFGCGAMPLFCSHVVRSIKRSAFGFEVGSSEIVPPVDGPFPALSAVVGDHNVNV